MIFFFSVNIVYNMQQAGKILLHSLLHPATFSVDVFWISNKNYHTFSSYLGKLKQKWFIETLNEKLNVISVVM